MMRGTGNGDESAQSVLLISTEPLAHAGNGGLEETSVGLMPRWRALSTRRKR